MTLTVHCPVPAHLPQNLMSISSTKESPLQLLLNSVPMKNTIRIYVLLFILGIFRIRFLICSTIFLSFAKNTALVWIAIVFGPIQTCCLCFEARTAINFINFPLPGKGTWTTKFLFNGFSVGIFATTAVKQRADQKGNYEILVPSHDIMMKLKYLLSLC